MGEEDRRGDRTTLRVTQDDETVMCNTVSIVALVEIIDSTRSAMEIIAQQDPIMTTEDWHIFETHDLTSEVKMKGCMIQDQVDCTDASNLLDGRVQFRNTNGDAKSLQPLKICFADQTRT